MRTTWAPGGTKPTNPTNPTNVARRAGIAVFAAALLLSACASLAPPADVPRTTGGGSSHDEAVALDDLARRQRQAAREAESQDRLADAAVAWEVVGLLEPTDTEATSHRIDLLRRIDEGVAAHLARAADARRRGDLEGAQREALQALALRPDDARGAECLRALEAERNRRTVLARKAGPLPAPSIGAAADAGGPVTKRSR